MKIESRPFIHLAQILSSAWITGDDIGENDLNNLLSFSRKNPYVSIWSKKTDLPEKVMKRLSSDSFVPLGSNVLWKCYRPLLPKFLNNSLSALERMQKKYAS